MLKGFSFGAIIAGAAAALLGFWLAKKFNLV